MPITAIRRHLERNQLLRFILVGAVNTAFSYGIYAGMLFIGFGYALANLVALVLGILFSFKTQGRFVFENTSNLLIGRFILLWAAIYLANIALIGSLITIGLDAYVAGALAVPFSTVLSYIGQKFIVFGKSMPRVHEHAVGEE
jgi:putative flippase GtrA